MRSPRNVKWPAIRDRLSARGGVVKGDDAGFALKQILKHARTRQNPGLAEGRGQRFDTDALTGWLTGIRSRVSSFGADCCDGEGRVAKHPDDRY
jgi:hypothetical protein